MLTRPDALALSYEFEPRRLGRRAVQVSLVIAVILVALMASVIAMNWRRGRRPRAYHATGAPRSAPRGIGRIHGGLVSTLMSTAAAGRSDRRRRDGVPADPVLAATRRGREELASVRRVLNRPDRTDLRAVPGRSMNGGAPWTKRPRVPSGTR